MFGDSRLVDQTVVYTACGLVAGEVAVHLLSTVEVPFEQGITSSDPM